MDNFILWPGGNVTLIVDPTLAVGFSSILAGAALAYAIASRRHSLFALGVFIVGIGGVVVFWPGLSGRYDPAFSRAGYVLVIVGGLVEAVALRRLLAARDEQARRRAESEYQASERTNRQQTTTPPSEL